MLMVMGFRVENLAASIILAKKYVNNILKEPNNNLFGTRKSAPET